MPEDDPDLKVRQNLFNTMAKLVDIAFLISAFLALACSVSAKDHNCYYIQVGTFGEKQNVTRLVKKYAKFNEKVVVNEVRSSRSGTMFQVLVGPFASWKEADSHKLVLRKKGVYLKDAFIRKIKNLPSCNPSEHKNSQPFYYRTDIKDQKPENKAVPPDNVREIGTSVVEGRLPEQTATVMAMSEQLPETLPAKRPSEVSTETIKEKTGRNIQRKQFSIALNHTYSEFQTNLEERQLITSNGGSTTVISIDTSSLSNIDFDTSMNRDTVRIYYGITDYFEVFADVGAAYKDLSKINLTYGIGGRLNLFTVDGQNGHQFYSAIIGEALFGEIEYDYDGTGGTSWNKQGDWQDLSARCEIGAVFSNFSLYAGGAYTYYSEKSDHRLLNNLPPSITLYEYEDEMVGDPRLGGFFGGTYHFTGKLHLNLEGQAGNPNELAGSLKYDF